MDFITTLLADDIIFNAVVVSFEKIPFGMRVYQDIAHSAMLIPTDKASSLKERAFTSGVYSKQNVPIVLL